jgi:hypothetical protein
MLRVVSDAVGIEYEPRPLRRRGRTCVIEMVSQILVSVSSCCDVEVALDFVSIQTPIYSACIRRASNPGGLAESSRLRFAELLMHIPQLFPARVHAVILAQLMHAPLHLSASPLRPVCGVVAQ